MTFAVFQWLERTSLSVVINESLWAFAVVEAIHLLALAVIGGAVLVVDLRLLGLAFQKQRVADLARVAQPWLLLEPRVMKSSGDFIGGAARPLRSYQRRKFNAGGAE